MSRNVVLVVLDTVRKDVFDDHATELRDQAGCVVEECRAASAWSVPSHASMLTGDLPHQHGVHTYERDFGQLDRDETFLGDLPDHEAIGVSANVYAGSAYGFDGLFDQFVDVSPTHRFPDGLDVREFGLESDRTGASLYASVVKAALGHDRPLASLGNVALSKLYHLSRQLPLPALLDDGVRVVTRTAFEQTRTVGEPYFLFVNVMDAHGPLQHVRGYDGTLHDAPYGWTSSDTDERDVVADPENYETYLRRYRGLYRAAVDYLDGTVAGFVDRLLDEAERETTVVVTADHGENLGYEADDGLLNHSSSLTEGLLHVPCLVVNPPAGFEVPDRRYVSHLQLAELVTQFAAGECPSVGADRVPAEVVGKTPGVRLPQDERWQNRAVRCIYEDGTKRVWDSLGDATQYTLDRERPCWQRRDRTVESVPDASCFDEPIAEYARQAAGSDQTSEIDESAASRLSDLGYL